MHQTLSAHHLPPEDIPNTLVSQANSQHGSPGAQMADHLLGDACLVRVARPWRDHQVARAVRLQLFDRDGIVADSVPEREYQECKHKARALVRAVEMAQGG